jgi:hypothetical protein
MTLVFDTTLETITFGPVARLVLAPVDPPEGSHRTFPDGARCPVDGALLFVEGPWADYSAGPDYPEPAYAQFCPLCELEWDL